MCPKMMEKSAITTNKDRIHWVQSGGTQSGTPTSDTHETSGTKDILIQIIGLTQIVFNASPVKLGGEKFVGNSLLAHSNKSKHFWDGD